MIRLDVYVAFTGKNYEFACDPHLPLSELSRQMIMCACKLEGLEEDHKRLGKMERDGKEGLIRQASCRMFSITDERELSINGSLVENGVRNGARLLLCQVGRAR